MAYECSPYRGSEWAAGWGRLLGAAKLAETHVVTSEKNYAALERAQAEGLMPPNVRFYTPQPDEKLRTLERKPVLFAYNYQAYNYWQRLALQLIQDLHAREHFDVVHQVNVCTFREPGYGWRLGVPFIWGPVGGTQNFPVRFLSMLPPKEAVKEGIRGITNWFALRKPRVRGAARQSALLIGANSTNQRDLSHALGCETGLLLETGLHAVEEVDRSRFEQRVEDRRAGRPTQPLRLFWSGELQTRKALPVLLRALAQLDPKLPWELDVLGDGPMRDRWEDEAKALGLGDRVRFLGRMPFNAAVEEMRSADVLCFTSLRDTSGNVVLEALGAGVPVICFDHQGARDMVTDRCGFKLPVNSPRRSINDWARAIEALITDPERLLELSKGATEQARCFLWAQNHEAINSVYLRLVNRSEERRQKQTAAQLVEVSGGAMQGTTQ